MTEIIGSSPSSYFQNNGKYLPFVFEYVVKFEEKNAFF